MSRPSSYKLRRLWVSSRRRELTRLATEIDAGLDPPVLADTFDMLPPYTERDLSLATADPAAIRNASLNGARNS